MVRVLPPRTTQVMQSFWTVLASLAAGMLLSGSITLFSGISALPALIVEVGKLTARLEDEGKARILVERDLTRLTTENAGQAKQITASEGRITVIAAMLERVQAEQRQADLQAQKGMVEIEGKSMIRDTEIKGGINELRTEVRALEQTVRRHQDEMRASGGREPPMRLDRQTPSAPSPSPQSLSRPAPDQPEFGHLHYAAALWPALICQETVTPDTTDGPITTP